MSVVFIIVTNALRDSALSCFGLSDFEQLHAHYGGGLPCRPRRYLTTFFLSLWTQSPDQTAMFLARLVCATTVQAFWRTTAGEIGLVYKTSRLGRFVALKLDRGCARALKEKNARYPSAFRVLLPVSIYRFSD